VQCETLTKELLLLKAANSADSKRTEKSIYLSRDEVDSSKGRNACNDLQLPIKKK
jgi:hypothetical protein